MTLEFYWLGVAIWMLAFCLHSYGVHWRYSYTATRAGELLCWIGFAATA